MMHSAPVSAPCWAQLRVMNVLRMANVTFLSRGSTPADSLCDEAHSAEDLRMEIRGGRTYASDP
jgi:hypothetical protein